MTPEAFQDTATHGAAVNLSTRAKFRLTGTDRVRYLNGQVTNDVRRASITECVYACVTDIKGRVTADIYIHATPDALLIDAEPGLREALGMRLERYIIADDVELADVTDDWQLWHVFGAATRDGIRSTRYGVPGADQWLPANESHEPACRILNAEEAETWRVIQHVPRWEHELDASTFPQEAGIETRAMDFAKGCYIGQEVLSRIKTTGKMPRELIAFESENEVQSGTELWLEKSVGKVTSVTRHPLTGRWVALAMVRQGSSISALRMGHAEGTTLTPL